MAEALDLGLVLEVLREERDELRLDRVSGTASVTTSFSTRRFTSVAATRSICAGEVRMPGA
jgi:hypothetical protein